MRREPCYCEKVFGPEFAAKLEGCPKTWCGLREFNEAVVDLDRLDPEMYQRHRSTFLESTGQMTALWTTIRGRNGTGAVAEDMLRKILSNEGFHLITGNELADVRKELYGLFRPDIMIRAGSKVWIVESTTWDNPDKLRADFFKGYVAAKGGRKLVTFIAELPADLSDTDIGFRKVLAFAQAEGYVHGAWGIRTLRRFLSELKGAS